MINEENIKVQVDRSTVNIPEDRKALQEFGKIWKKVYGNFKTSPDQIGKYKSLIKKIKDIDGIDDLAGLFIFMGKKFRVEVNKAKYRFNAPTPWRIAFEGNITEGREMNKILIEDLRQMIYTEIRNIVEADDDEKIDAEKEKIEKEKLALDKEKFDFQKKQADDADRESDQREADKEKEDSEKEKEEKGEKEKKPESNISFNTQGRYYTDAMAQLDNITLSGGNMIDDDEKNFVSLAIQAAEGRFDKGFEKYLRKGYAGNVYGRDFSDTDVKIIMKYCKDNEIVR